MGVALTIGKPPECTFKESLEVHITVQLKTRMLGMWLRPEIPAHRAEAGGPLVPGQPGLRNETYVK